MTTFHRRKRMEILRSFWAWDVLPFLFNPIQSIRDMFRKERFTDEELADLTPEERKALK
jgi:hypothetical protein